jgi:hypothetical protein
VTENPLPAPLIVAMDWRLKLPIERPGLSPEAKAVRHSTADPEQQLKSGRSFLTIKPGYARLRSVPLQ